MKLIVNTIKLSLSILLLWWLVYTSKLDFNLLFNLLYSPFFLSAILLLYMLIIVIGAWRWHLLNNVQMIHLSLTKTLLPAYLGIAFNNLLPGGVGGDIFRFYLLNKHTQAKKSAVMMSILFDRLTGLMGIFIVTGFIAIFQLKNMSDHSFVQFFMLLCLCMFAGMIAVCVIAKLFPRILKLSDKISNQLAQHKWAAPFSSVLDSIRVYRHAGWVIVRCLLLSVVIQIFIAIVCILIATTMHFPALPISHYIIALAITQIVNLIPITPGGFGIGEMAFANALTILNPDIGGTLATIFLAYRVIGLLIYLPGIFLFAFNHQALNLELVTDNP